MKILALDSSGLVASVAVLEDDNLIGEYTVNYKKTHSQTLLPMLDALAQMIELDLSSLDAIAVAGGPGSFTGLRIGSATAKGLALALDKPIVHVPTVEALAYNLYETKGVICPIMDARRQQVYTGVYRWKDRQMETVADQMAVDIAEVEDLLASIGEEVVFLGDGVSVFRDRLEREMKVPFRFAPPHVAKQRAAAVGALALVYARAGRLTDADLHRPDYLRVSQAERERAGRLEKQKSDQKGFC